MTYSTITKNQEVKAVDIQTMGEMSTEDYQAYIREELLWVDHHDVLRSGPAEYPLAVTKTQFKALLAYLKELEPRIGT